MMLRVVISLLFLIESDISHDLLSSISCSPSASSSGLDLSSSRARSHHSIQVAIILFL